MCEQAHCGAARGGASRQTMAAMMAAAIRTCATQAFNDVQDEEVATRLSAIAPTIAAHIDGKVISGEVRARRSLASHNFELGVPLTAISGAQSKRLQRAGRCKQKPQYFDLSWQMC